MKLTDYLEKNTQTALADKLGVTQGLISQWIKDKTKITAERAIQIETATEGKVARQDLRPDIFGQPQTTEAA